MIRKPANWLLLLALAAPPAAHALSTDKNQPVQIEADQVELDEHRGVSVYTGDVKVTRGSMRLTGDTMTVYNKGDQLDRIIVVGKPATYKQRPDNQQEDMHASAERIEYYADGEKVILQQNARLWQGINEFKSERIVYDIPRGVANAGNAAPSSERQRVRITIQPKTKDAAAPTASGKPQQPEAAQ